LSILSRSVLLATGLGLGLSGMAGAMVVAPG
jgi:hypothetical protein